MAVPGRAIETALSPSLRMNSDLKSAVRLLEQVELKLAAVKAEALLRLEHYQQAKDSILAESLDIFILKLDEVSTELRNTNDKMLQSVFVSAAARDKIVKFIEFLDKLNDFVGNLSKRKLFSTSGSINEKVKIWNLELNVIFQELLTSICLIYEELVSKDQSMLITSPASSTRDKTSLSLTKKNLSALNKQTSGSPQDTLDEVSPETIQLIADIQDSSLSLRSFLEQYTNALDEKHPNRKEKSREDVIFSGMTHLMEKIDSELDEIRENKPKILEALSGPAVYTNAGNFYQTVQEFQEFFVSFDKLMYYKFKGQVKKKLQLINLIFSSRWNHFMTSVCLNVNLKPLPEKGLTFYDEGLKYLHGIGFPRNLNLAYAHFLEGAENDDVLCMNALAQCYHLGLGVESDIDAAQKWLQRGINKGSSDAKCSLALLLISEIQDSDIDAQDREILVQHAISLLYSAANEVIRSIACIHENNRPLGSCRCHD